MTMIMRKIQTLWLLMLGAALICIAVYSYINEPDAIVEHQIKFIVTAAVSLTWMVLLWFSRFMSMVICSIVFLLLAFNILIIQNTIVSTSYSIGYGDSDTSTPSISWIYVLFVFVNIALMFPELFKYLTTKPVENEH